MNEEKFNKLHKMTVTIERFIDDEGKLIISKFQINPMQLYSAESLAPLFAKKSKRFAQYCLSLYPMMQPIPGGRGCKKKWLGIAVIDYLEAEFKIHQSNKKKKTQDDSTEDDPKRHTHIRNIRMVYLKSIADVSTSRQPIIIFGMPHKEVITLLINKLTHLNQLQYTESFFQTLILRKVMIQC